MAVNVLLAQVPISWDVADNVTTVRSVLEQANAQDLVVAPEGMISGYDDQLSGLSVLDPRVVSDAIDVIAKTVREKNVHLFCGTLLFDNEAWSNAVLYFSPEGEPQVYRKVNLATHERSQLVAGSVLPLFNLKFAEQSVMVSPQLCREIRFPDQWHCPAREGAQLFVYLANAANSEESMDVWRSHLISRAAETQRFVIAANVAHPDRHCPTMVIAPSGEVVAEARSPEPTTIRATIDMASVSDWYVTQQRCDLIRISYVT
ncbi:MAG TPA: carbon-nitrogen hydrolase family protein [Acidimicrobiales bacterium]|nr:carbon-nitrogen hydrolase family protein [Acidimicrobiales bacterium]